MCCKCVCFSLDYFSYVKDRTGEEYGMLSYKYAASRKAFYRSLIIMQTNRDYIPVLELSQALFTRTMILNTKSKFVDKKKEDLNAFEYRDISHINRRFKKNKQIHEYFLNLMLQSAQHLLVENKDPFAERNFPDDIEKTSTKNCGFFYHPFFTSR